MLRTLNHLVDVAYKTGLVRPVRVPGVRVISVGALTLGGAGKTPLAMAIARDLRAGGYSTAVVLRGYRGSCERRGALVSDGRQLFATVEQAGDEAVLHARRLPGVIVRVCSDRALAVRHARADGAQIVVVDDGLQHRRLARDLDVVLIAEEGLRRESDSALRRAGILVSFGAPVPPEPKAPTLVARVVARSIVRGPGLTEAFGPERLRGARVALACAIARPLRFVRLVQALGARVVSLRTRPDHERLRASDLRPVLGADVVLVTEKDAVKLGEDVLALRIDVDLDTSPILATLR